MSLNNADLRPRMTRRAAQFLERGEPLLVAGGPLTGKSTMLRHLGAAMPGLLLYDDISPGALPALIESGDGGWAASVDAMGLVALGDLPGVRVLPLVNLAPADLRRACEGRELDFRELFAWSAGHPYLVAHYPDRERRDVLRTRLGQALAVVPDAGATYAALLGEGELAGASLYRAARRRFGTGCKKRLDLLAVMGAITRFISDERAALRLLFPEPALSSDVSPRSRP